MTVTPPHSAGVALPGSLPRHDQQLKDARFLESLQGTLASCGKEADVYGAAVHRVAAAFDTDAACLASYDPIAATVTVIHQARAKRTWELDLLLLAVTEERTVSAGHVLAAPVVCEGRLCSDERAGSERRTWGVLAIAHEDPSADGNRAIASRDALTISEPRRGVVHTPATADRINAELERQKLRAAAERIGVELERRRVSQLDDVLDGLLRKTKPIDVYTHALRDLRRFIRYDHSASIMTIERGMPQVVVRVEKLVRTRGKGETLVDSPRRARALRLTMAQARHLSRLDRAIALSNDGTGWRQSDGQADPDAAGLWRVLSVDGANSHDAPDHAGTQPHGADHQAHQECSILYYPLIFGGQMLGILRLGARRARAFEPQGQHIRLLDRFARLLAVTLYRSEQYYQSDRQLRAIKEMGSTITTPMPVEDICRHVLNVALRVLHVQVGAVGLVAEDGTLEIVAHQGCTRDRPPLLALGKGISGTVVQTGKPWAVPDVTREPGYVVFNDRVRSELVAPITYDREVIGFLNVESFEEQRFREEDEEVITFLESLANQAAIAIKTAQLRKAAGEAVDASLAIDPALTTVGLYQRIIDELRANNERLLAANRAKSEFLATMSHELRTPLNAIIGFSNLLLNPEVAAALTDEDRRQSLEDIRSSGHHLLTLINDILDLSRVEAGKVRLAVVPFAARPIFENSRIIAETLAAEGCKTLAISVEVAPEITTIMADEGKFRQIMYNLISNAVKFTPPGGRVAITATRGPGFSMEERTAAALAMPDDLVVAVSDTGIGVAAADHERIFQAFQQIDSSASRQYPGTGLGLALVRQFVGLHGGRVWLESSPGQGSTFFALFPHALRRES